MIVQARSGRFTLRVHGASVEETVVRSEVFWLNSLCRDANVSVPCPVQGLDGRDVQLVEIADGSRYCTAYHWIEGEMLARVSGSQRTAEAIGCHSECERSSCPSRTRRFMWTL